MKDRDLSEKYHKNKFVINSKEEIKLLSKEEYKKMVEDGIFSDDEYTKKGDD